MGTRADRPDASATVTACTMPPSGARADIDDYRVDYILPRLSPSEVFWQQLSERVSLTGLFAGSTGDSVAVLRALSQPLLNAAAEVASLQDPRHLYFRCLGCSALD